jgi:translation initiation factor 3 subunit D
METNHLKLMKWAVQSYLAGASKIKIGFVTRNNTKDNTSHAIVGFYDINIDEIIKYTNFSKSRA